MDRHRPAATSAWEAPRESADWMAVSINTVHRSPSSTALGALRARGPNSANGIPMRAACSSTKEPVPAVQILFI